jgi:hypothetical protein
VCSGGRLVRKRTSILTIVFTAAIGLISINPSHAQDTDSNPDKRVKPSKFTGIVTACTVDYPKFCPNPGNTVVSGRDQFICLKFFKADLSLGCRRAVLAAKQ